MASVRSQLVTTPPGGPSTITGAVYQMLWCLLRTLQLNVAEVERDGAGVITRATLILEPRGGGDVHELGEARRRVIQLKTRSGGRSWSLRDVIVGVFPDLYRSVNLSAEDSSYDFVTDADMGEWPDVYAFFHSLRDRIPGDAPLEQLDDEADIPGARRTTRVVNNPPDGAVNSRRGAQTGTRRMLFEEIVDRLRRTNAVPSNEPIETTRRKLWHLLGRFRFIGKQALSQLEAEIDALLSALVDHPEQVAEKRNALLGWLACHARAGNAILQTDNVLREHGLDVTPLTDWSTLRAKAIDLYRRLIELRQYNESFDVRRREVAQFRSGWGPEKPLLGITGESGDGKSWALLALGLHMSADPAVVMLVDATGTADGTLRRAAEFFCQEVKGHGTAPPLSVIARQLKKVLPKRAGFWLTLLVDGVQSRSEAEQLARRPLEDWGVRLAVTGPPDVVKVFQNAAAGRAKVVTVDAFTPTQRDDYLQRRLGDAWVRIPADIRDTLRRPLLANIYCEQVAIEKGWNPTHEYDLYDVMWERLRTGAHNPGTYDATRLARLAATVLDDVTYPWPAGGLEQAGIEEIAVKSLCRAGWVRRNADGKYEVPHDRLLNYAVARGLVEAYELDKTGEDRLIQTLRQLLFDPRAWSGRRLGYVPMDVFYIMLREPTGLDPCARWLAALDDMGHIERESLYVDLLPTLGTRALPLLFARLEACEGADALYRQHPIIEGINACATAGTHLLIRQLLNSDNPRLHRAALKILATHPDPSVLDRLWQLHGQMLGDPVRYGERAGFHVNLYQDSMDALRACAELEPSWIERMVRATPAAHPYIHDLAYLLAGVSNGADVWRRCKAELIEKVPAGKIRSIIVNVGRYRDGDELHRLPPMVGEEADSVGPAAVQAIARIDPDAAVEHLVRLSGFEMYLARHWFLDRLLEVRRADVNGKLLAHMRESDDVWTIAAVYSGNEQEVDVETLEFLLDELDALLVHTAESPPPPNQHPLSRPLQLLAAMNRLDLLECLRRRQGSPLEQHLADFLIATGPRDGRGVDPPEQECAFAVLSKIGGAAFERVVNHCLVHGVHFGRLRAIAAAHRCEGIEVVQHLADIAASAESSEASSLEQEKATEALACLGQTRLLVESLVKLGLHISPDIDELATASRPFDDTAIEPALQILADTSSTESQRASAVIALGVAGRRDQVATILDILEGAAPDSYLALACTIAIGNLGDTSEKALSLLKRHLAAGKNPYLAHQALLRADSDAALDIALDHVRQHYDERMAVNLTMRPQTAKAALSLIANHVASATPREALHRLELPLASLGDADINQLVSLESTRQSLREAVLADEERFCIAGSRARSIRAVAAFDPNTAFLAAQKALESPKAHDRLLYPSLLVDMDEKRAVPVLIKQCVVEESTLVRHAIARALAKVDITADIQVLIESPRRAEREIGCLLCGFRKPGEPLRQMLRQLIDDTDGDVADAALGALRQLRFAEYANQLVAAAAGASRNWLWTVLDALLEVGDLGDEGVGLPEWLRQVSPTLAADMRHHAIDKVKDRWNRRANNLNRRRR